jgi:hypothetical protein
MIWGLVVAMTWFYTYSKTKLKAFSIIGLAVLISWVFSTSISFLMGFTEISSFVIRQYASIGSVVVGILWMILNVYGIVRLIREFKNR